MYQLPEQVMSFNRANLEMALKFAGVALEGTERLMDVQMKAAKSALADSIQGARALASVRDVEQLSAIKDNIAQPSLEKATSYAKQVYDVAAATQADLSRLIEEQVSEINKQVIATLDQLVKTAPAGSEIGIAAVKTTLAAMNSGFDNLTKVAKQVSETTQNNAEVVADQTIEAAKKARRAA